ncbi:MAG: S8 family serine peptidase [Elusimicrobiota bacterium]
MRVAVALFLCVTAAGAQNAKLDARLQAARAAGRALAPAGVLSGARRPVLLRVTAATDLAVLRATFPGVRFGSQSGPVVTAWASDAEIDALTRAAGVLRIEAAVRAAPTLDTVRSSSSVSGQALGTIYGAVATDLANATGAGVVAGFIDTGIDWTHKDFINDAPNTSRILAIWDQTISSHAGGPFPAGFSYGAEYVNAQITAKLQGGGGAINTVDTQGHGTHVASIAAGDGSDTNGALPAGTFKGIAPDADIVMVKTTYLTGDMIDGVNYIISRAAAAGKRAVINMSLGTQSGPHDGTSSFEEPLGIIAQSTPVVVSMGNDAAKDPHAQTVVGAGGSAAFTVSITGTPNEADVEFWVPNGDGYTATVTLAGVAGSLSAVGGSDQNGTLGGHGVWIFNATDSDHPYGDRQIYVYVYRSGGITAASLTVTVTRTLSSGSGRIDGYVNPAAKPLRFTTLVEVAGSLGEPACAAGVFGVASYASKESWRSIDGGTYNFPDQAPLGSVSAFSSRGPTRDGRVRPEISAPGDAVMAALSLDPAARPADSAIAPDARHRILRGTSMSAPVVTAILAARLQWGPNRGVSDLRQILQAQARADPATSSVPNNTWGYGKVASSPQPVSAPSSLGATTLGISSIVWSWSSVIGGDAYSLYYATSPAVSFDAGALGSYTQTGLAPNTTYSYFIAATGAGVPGPLSSAISTSTYSGPPSGLPAITPYVSSFTVAFTPCPAAPQAASCWGYVLDASTSPSFNVVSAATTTNNRADSSLVLTGLQPLTTYYFRLATLNANGGWTSTGTVSAVTLSHLVAPSNPRLTSLTTQSILLQWDPNSNTPGVSYTAHSSTSPVFNAPVLTGATTGTSWIFSGLTANTSYYFRVQAAGGPFLDGGLGATLAATPGVATPAFTAIAQSEVTVTWSAAGNPSGTAYLVECSSAIDFSAPAVSSQTGGLAATLTGLAANTRYYARVSARSHGGTASAYAPLGSTSTLSAAPASTATPFPHRNTNALTVSWMPLPLTPQALACEGYRVDLSLDAGFAAIAVTTVTDAGSSQAAFAGLNASTTYYARVGALNWDGVANYLVIGSTTTSVPAISSGVVGSGAMVLSLVPSFAASSLIRITFDAGTFPPGTTVSLSEGLSQDLTSPRSLTAGLTSLGTSAGFELTAQGRQPLKPVRLILAYVPAHLPAGGDERRLILARFDEASAQWVPLASAVDQTEHLLISALDHFSAFAPFLASAGTAVSAGRVFPQPWEIGSPSGSYGAASLTFANFPAGSKVRILTLSGERVWDGETAANGMLAWDGRNRSGRGAASGTYYAVIEAGGEKSVRRLVIVR